MQEHTCYECQKLIKDKEEKHVKSQPYRVYHLTCYQQFIDRSIKRAVDSYYSNRGRIAR